MGLGEIFLEPNGLAELDLGLVQLAVVRKEIPEVVVGQGKVFVEAEGFPELGNGLVQQALLDQRISQVLMGQETLRPESGGDGVLAERLLLEGMPVTGQMGSQLVVKPEIAGIPLPYLPQNLQSTPGGASSLREPG